MQIAESVLVFVYGTLKQGFPNFSANKGRRVPGIFMTCERLPLYLVGDRHSPWLINMPGQGEHVCGQVFEVNAETLAGMDLLERTGMPDGYHRTPIQVYRLADETSPPISVAAYLKSPASLANATIIAGPLHDYSPEHARTYRKRAA